MHTSSDLKQINVTEYLTTKEAADFLRLSVKTLLNQVSSGRIPYRKLGRSNRYKKTELEKLIEKNKRGP